MPVPYATNVDAEAYDVGCTAVEGSARAARQSRLADILQVSKVTGHCRALFACYLVFEKTASFLKC